jgi:methionyl-tRNA formyltransferase
MRLLFLGSPQFAVPTLRALHAARHEIACVVTRPDRPRGRHGRPQPTAVKEAALALALDVYQPDSVNRPESVEKLSGLKADLGLTVAYGEILRPAVLAAARDGFLNVHASLLPDYRGAAPINWAILRGDTVTGVTIIRMTPRLDAGPILAETRLEIGAEETAGQLQERLAAAAAELASDLVGRLAAGEEVPARPQPPEAGFVARKLTKEDGRIPWALPARQIVNRVRGMTPWPGAWADLRSRDGTGRVTLLAVRPEKADGTRPGEVMRADAEGILVGVGEGAVRVLRLKPSGGRAMSAADFLRGHPIQPGDEFL